MVSSTATSAASARKRQRTDDMLESPPKRVTRSRAAKAAESKNAKESTAASTAPTPRKITTASARAMTSGKSTTKATAAKPARSSATRTRKATSGDDTAASKPAARAASKRTAVGTAVSTEATNPHGAMSAAPTRTRRAASATVEAAEESRSLPQSRTRRALRSIEPVPAQKQPEPVPASKPRPVARGRPAGVTKSAAPRTRKTVTFAKSSASDKENMPAQTLKGNKAASKGVICKKPSDAAAVESAGKSERVAEHLSINVSAVQPLSPKKITQVAKGGVSELELGPATTSPRKFVASTPSKIPIQTFGASPSPRKAAELPLKSPTRDSQGDVPKNLASPARRPPASPYKHAMKESPRKFAVSLSTHKSGSAVKAHTTMKDLLQQSPRKLASIASPIRSAKSQIMHLPSKSVLFTSPAKRPASPIKGFDGSTPKLRNLPSGTSPAEAQVLPDSPVKAPHLSMTPQTPELDGIAEAGIGKDLDAVTLLSAAVPAVTPFVTVRPDVLPLAEVPHSPKLPRSTSPLKFRSAVTAHDLDAEDSTICFPGAPSAEVLTAVHHGHLSTNSDASRGRSRAVPNDVAMTPLAVQLSRWFASSPQKDTVPSKTDVGSGDDDDGSQNKADAGADTDDSNSEDELATSMKVFTPVAALRTSRRASSTSVARSPAKAVPTFFEDQIVIHEAEKQTDELLRSDLQTQDLHIGASTTLDIPLEEPGHAQTEEAFGDENAVPMQELSMLIDSPVMSQVTAPSTNSVEEAIADAIAPSKTPEDLRTPGPSSKPESILPDPLLQLETSPAVHNSVLRESASGDTERADQVATPQISVLIPHAASKTPASAFEPSQRLVHTVCKVPLRPEGQVSPIKLRKHRSRSLSNTRGVLTDLPILDASHPSAEVPDEADLPPEDVQSEQPKPTGFSMEQPSPTSSSLPLPASPPMALSSSPYASSPLSTHIANAASPTKSVRAGADAQILRGAVVYVDVHTSEGADASSIFIDLLNQMGAKCVKQWAWGRRTSSASSSGTESTASSPSSTSSAACATSPRPKVDITHVVFKDGSKRTLQRVCASQGLVACVGVGWVLDCERGNCWLDEAEYAVDVTSMMARMGSSRRRSMEPRAPSTRRRSSTGSTHSRSASTVKAAQSNLVPIDPQLTPLEPRSPDLPVIPATPTILPDAGPNAVSSWASPTTPYFLSQGAELMQKTCPAKQQTRQKLFPVSGDIDDEPDAALRRRLMVARRKSLQWAPKIKSPLGRTMDV